MPFELIKLNSSKTTLAICCLLIFTFAITSSAEEDGQVWLKAIDDAERVEHSYGVVKQTITTSGGNVRTLTMRSWSDEAGESALMAYTGPARVRGDKILLRNGGDDIWYYMKRRDVTRHFARHTQRQKAMGSDFSYEDFSQGSMSDDYSVRFIGFETLDKLSCVKLELTPGETGPSYHHLILWAGREDKLLRKLDYYDEDGLLKTLTLTDFREIEGRRIAHHLEMVNRREGSRTVLEYESFTMKTKPDKTIFTKDALSNDIR